MKILSTLSDLLIDGFILSTILLFICYLVSASNRQSLNKIISVLNLLLITGATLFLILAVKQLLSYKDTNDEWGNYALTNRILGPYWFAYLGAIIFKGLLPQILWVKRFRNSIWTSMILLPFLLVDFYMPYFYSSNSNYLPSTFRPTYLALIFPALIYFGLLTVFSIATRKKAERITSGL